MKNTIFFSLITFSVFAQNGIKGFYSVSLSVKNLEESLAFYKDAIGFTEGGHFTTDKKVKVESKSGIQHIARKSVFMQCPNGRIELIEFQSKIKPEPSQVMFIQGPGITHMCYQSSANHSLYNASKSRGVFIVSRGNVPVNRGFGIQYAYIKDVNNIMFETEQLDKPPFTENMWIGHVAIATPNLDKTVDFYTKLFGFKPHNRINGIKNNPKLDDIANIDSLKLNVAWFKSSNMQLEIWQFDNPQTAPPQYLPSFSQIGYNKISFEVKNLDLFYNQMREMGIEFLSKPVKTKDKKEVMLRDPDGNLLLLIELSPHSPLSIDNFKKISK